MRIFIKYLGFILIISSFFRVVPIIAGIIYKEPISGFIIGALLSAFLGIVLLWVSSRIDSKESFLSLPKALTLVALSFIIIPMIGAMPFMLSFDNNFLDASFESVSGFTTTGLTLYDSLDNLPKSLLLWRAETQWMGGIGIIMIFIFIFCRLKSSTGSSIPESEAETQTTSALFQANGFSEKLEPGLKRASTNIMIIYGGFTLLGIMLLLLTGMSVFESIGMTFTSLSTGGFTLSDTFYSSNAQLFVLGLLMILGSISFIIHNKLLQRKFKEFFSSFPINSCFAFIILSVILTLFIYPDVKVVIFELVSSFTTTGYSITDISLLPSLFIMMIMIGMIVGGGIASTSGGIKAQRAHTILRMIPWMVKKQTLPTHAVVPFKVKGKSIEEKDLLLITVFVLCYMSLIVIGTIIFMFMGFGALDSSFQITSALGTVGMQTMELGSLPVLGKIILMFAMVLGRLEVFPVLILIRRIFRS